MKLNIIKKFVRLIIPDFIIQNNYSDLVTGNQRKLDNFKKKWLSLAI